MRFIKVLLALIIVIAIVYLLGPHPDKPIYNEQLPAVPQQYDSLEKMIQANESMHKIKPNNEARIVWANDSL